MAAKLLMVTPYGEMPADVLASINEAAHLVSQQIHHDVKVVRQAGQSVGFIDEKLVRQDINGADALIADLSAVEVNTVYEIGFAQGRGKPVIALLRQNSGFTLQSPIVVWTERL